MVNSTEEISSVDVKPGIARHLSHGVTAIEAANSLEFLSAAFDCYSRGEVFAVTRTDVAVDGYGVPVTPLRHVSETRGWGQLRHTISTCDTPAQIVFTSGTEGRPKAIVLTHRNLGDVVARLNDVMRITPEIREYIGVPVTYSFGLGRARAVSAAGGAFYLPDRFDPGEIRTMLEAGEINAISAVPSLWRLILGTPEAFGAAGRMVRWIEIGSQYMSSDEKLALRQIFPEARIVQHYGMTEASRSTFLVVSDEDDPDRLESVGPAGDRVRINRQGAIEITGDHVAPGQLEPDGALVPLAGSDGWLTTSDRGEIRDGLLYYFGRLDDQMNLAGIKVGAEALEARIAALIPDARGHFALTSVPDPMRGEVVVLTLEPPATEMRDLIVAGTQKALKEKGINAGGSLRVVIADILPRTETGKIRRAALREAGIPSPEAAAKDKKIVLTAEEARITALWKRVLGDVQITPDTGFYDSGGDSLSGLQVGLVMEGAGLPRAAVQATFEGASLRTVAAAAEGTPPPRTESADVPTVLPDRTRLTWSLTLTRALVVMAVLLSHWGPGVLNRLDLPQTLFISFTRIGTPGFAFVFGIGVGLYMLPEMARAPRAVFHRTDRAAGLVAAGVVLMTAAKMTHFYLRGDPMNWLTISNAIYSVLIYYLVALVSTRLWLPLLARLSAPVPALLFIAMALWLGWELVNMVLPRSQYVSPLELVRLMAGAGGYNVFKLGCMTAAGIAVGTWVARQADMDLVQRRLLLVGAIGALFCGGALLEAYGTILFRTSTSMQTSAMGLGFYGSVCVLTLGASLALLLLWTRTGSALRVPLRVALTFGGLALPIYVFHQLVLPIYDSLLIVGLPDTLALALPMGTFLAVMLYMGGRLYRMYGS